MHALRGAVIASLLAFARIAEAEQGRPFALSYEAPSDCPTAADLSARIRASTAHARPAAGEEPRYDVSVVVARSDNGFLASLQIHAPDGSATSRAVPGPTCAEVVDAVSLIVAITIDPEAAAIESARLEAAAKQRPESATKPEGPPQSLPTKEEPQKKEAPNKPELPRATDVSPNGKRLSHYFADAGAGVVLFAIAPDPTLDFHLGFAFELETDAVFAPRIDLSLHGAVSFKVTTPEGTAQFERWAGRLNACPFRWGNRSTGFRPCALFEAGYYAAKGDQTVAPDLIPFIWGAPGLALRGDLGVSRRWRAYADLGVLFPLLAGNSFYFDPSGTNVHEIPPVGAFLDLGIEFQIL